MAMLTIGICRPCHTAVQQDAEDTGLVHVDSVSAPFSHTQLISLDRVGKTLPMRLLISDILTQDVRLLDVGH